MLDPVYGKGTGAPVHNRFRFLPVTNNRYSDQYIPARTRWENVGDSRTPTRKASEASFWNCHCRFFLETREEANISSINSPGSQNSRVGGCVQVHPGSDPPPDARGTAGDTFALAQWKSGVRNMTPSRRFQSSRRARSACRLTGPARGLRDAVTSLAAPTQHGRRDKDHEAAASGHRYQDDGP